MVYTWKILQEFEEVYTKPFSGFELLYVYESVFPLIRESISEAIKRKLSNRDYKKEKMRGHVGNLT